MSRISDLVKQLCPGGVEFSTLAQLGEITRGKRFVKADLVESGVPCIHYGEIYTKYGVSADHTVSFVSPGHAQRLRKARPGDVVIASAGETVEDIGKAVAWLGPEDVVIHDACYAFRGGLDPTYVAYFFQTSEFHDQIRRHVSTAKISSISTENLGKVRIATPPLAVQQEIVRVLDSFASLEAQLRAELVAEREARQIQQAHYRTRILGLSEESRTESDAVALSEMVEFTNGKPHERLVVPDGSVALLTARFISTAGRLARWVAPENALTPAHVGDIAMVMSDLPNGRALAKCFYVEESEKYTANQRVCLLRIRDEKALSPRWLYHFLDRNPQLLAYDNGQDQTHLKKGQILDIRVPVTSLADQERSVVLLDQLDGSTRDLRVSLQAERETRRKQYEYYRDRLLTFEEAVT